MTRPEQDTDRKQDETARAEPIHVAPEHENFEHQLKRLVAARNARRAERPGLYR